MPVPPDQVLDLGDDAWLASWQRPDLPAALMNELVSTLPWEQPSLQLFGRWHRIPRLQCWCGDAGMSYRYSGRRHDAHPWNAPLQTLRTLAQEYTGQRYNSVLVNLYRDGADSMGWHADDEASLGATPWIASWSLGAERDFTLRRRGSHGIEHVLPLQHGQLLLMSPAVQRDWQHALPRRRRVSAARLNLTFRYIVRPD